MEQKRTIHYYMRVLHRNIGYFLIGLVIIYALSGIILIYRDTDLLKTEVTVEKNLPANTDPSKLGEMLRIRDFKISKTEGNIVFFENGNFDKSTGLAKYVTKEPLPFVNKFLSFHKPISRKPLHWVNLLFGISMLFMAISSFWMHKKGSALFRKGIYIAAAGFIIALVLVFI